MITSIDIEVFEEIIQRATRDELDKLDTILQEEIYLSEQAIKEGMEKRR